MTVLNHMIVGNVTHSGGKHKDGSGSTEARASNLFHFKVPRAFVVRLSSLLLSSNYAVFREKLSKIFSNTLQRIRILYL